MPRAPAAPAAARLAPSRARLPALALLAGASWYVAGRSFALWRPSASSSEPVPGATQRRQLVVGGFGAAAVAAAPGGPALAYETYKDVNNGYTFTYPTGLQKSENKLYDLFVRDLIEPLESVGVKVTPTSRKTLNDIGDAKTVGLALMNDTVPAKAPQELISATSKTDKSGRRVDIIEYVYQWKFDPEMAKQVGRKKFQLHNRALITIDRKKQYLVLVSAEEPRWPIQGDQLGLAVDTFKLLFD